MAKSTLPDDYTAFLNDLKRRIQESQFGATLSVNREMVLLYWHIGREILKRQSEQRWGAKIIDGLAADLKNAFPEMKGFSHRNLKYMRAFAEAWPEEAIVQQFAAQLPWFHNCVLLDKLQGKEARLWYAKATIEQGWSRSVLVHHIESNLHKRSGSAITNFAATLPTAQSELAQQITKDPYTFEFLMLGKEAVERDLEQGLVGQLKRFLLELGVGFAFVASQYRLEVDGSNFFLDLLFYHLKLRCFFVIDLKAKAFEPEFVGKMNFYLAVVDDQLKHPTDQPSIGLIICKTKNRIVAEYALRNSKTPIGISEYRLAERLPPAFQDTLPTIEQLETELGERSDQDE